MPTALVVAEPDDRLADSVCTHLRAGLRCTERDLLSGCGFSLEQDGMAVAGSLLLGGKALPFAELTGVLFRPVRRWRAPAAVGRAYRGFVQHETQAAWCAVLSALPCPVLNRLGPAWWCGDDAYRASLAHSLARALGLPAAPTEIRRDPRGAGVEPAGPDAVDSVYLLGKHVEPDCEAPAGIRSQIAARAKELAQWERQTGIAFARLDLVDCGGWMLVHVEPLPAFGRVRRRVQDAVGARLARMLA